jgi:phosphatidylethanolamine-binding protein (PEBP) family uncharacterized protein
MELSDKFAEASTSIQAVSVGSLDPGKKYPIVYAKRMACKFGSTVLVTFQTSDPTPVQAFLPKRYADVMSDGDILRIQNNDVSLHLVYKGIRETTKTFVLAIE